MLICSNSTRKYFPDEKDIYTVVSAPTAEILDKIGIYEDAIAVGGGSVIDTAKILCKGEPVCYPTTAAGSCNTSHSVYWEGPIKKSIKRIIPTQVFIEEMFIRNLPNSVVEYTVYDALSHCLDSMWSVKRTGQSLYYVDKALEILKGVYTNVELISAGNLAGTAIELCPTTILHALSYPLTGFYKIPHGKALGFLLPAVCNYMNFDLDPYIKYPKVTLSGVDINFVVKESLHYNKIIDVDRKIDISVLLNILEAL